MKADDVLLYLSIIHEGDWDAIYEDVRKKRPLNVSEVQEVRNNCKTTFITIVDPEYPDSLKKCIKPPFVLFYQGDISLLNEEKNTLAYIGSREASKYGLNMTEKIVKVLAQKGLILVTGLAKGIDYQAAKTALDYGGKVIGILGNGIEYCYPSSSQDVYERTKCFGLLISEYPGFASPSKEHFPMRNRLVAALASGVLIGEAHPRSGTLITAHYAMELGKDIGCVPFNADQESMCNALIKDGAFLIENAEDALLMIGFQGYKCNKKEISKNL